MTAKGLKTRKFRKIHIEWQIKLKSVDTPSKSFWISCLVCLLDKENVLLSKLVFDPVPSRRQQRHYCRFIRVLNLQNASLVKGSLQPILWLIFRSSSSSIIHFCDTLYVCIVVGIYLFIVSHFTNYTFYTFNYKTFKNFLFKKNKSSLFLFNP